MRQSFFQFLEKQDKVPAPGQVVMGNRAMLNGVVTSASFDEKKARAFVQKVTAVMEYATVNRLQQRHDLYQSLRLNSKSRIWRSCIRTLRRCSTSTWSKSAAGSARG